MFTVNDNGTLCSFSLLNQKLHTYKLGNYGLRNIKKVALDYHQQMIYAAGRLASANDNYCIVRLDYDDTVLTTVFQGSALNLPYGLDVFKGSIVWVDYNSIDMKESIYICILTPNCREETVKVLHRGTQVNIFFVFFYFAHRPGAYANNY